MALSNEILNRFSRGDLAKLSKTEQQQIDEDVNQLLCQIRNCRVVHQAEPWLEELGELTAVMATLAFQYDAGLTTRQDLVVREYDRPDDPDARNYVFEKIRGAQYPWSSEPPS